MILDFIKIALIYWATVSACFAQIALPWPGPGMPATSGVSLSLDGTPVTTHQASGPSTVSPAFTTTKTNDVVVVTLSSNGFLISSVSDTAGLTWNRITSLTPPNAGAAGAIDVFYAISAATLSGDVVTVTATASCFCTIIVFAVNGAHTAAPFDASGPTTTSSGSTWATLTTTSNNTFGVGVAVTSTSTPGTGWTNQAPAALPGFNLTDTQIFSTHQTGNVFDTGSVTPAVSVTFAIIQGP